MEHCVRLHKAANTAIAEYINDYIPCCTLTLPLRILFERQDLHFSCIEKSAATTAGYLAALRENRETRDSSSLFVVVEGLRYGLVSLPSPAALIVMN